MLAQSARAVRALAALATAVLLAPAPARAQATDAAGGAGAAAGRDSAAAAQRAPAWYERLSLRGYTQVRYSRLFETNPNLVCPQCDRAIGRNGGVSVRRGRLIVSGDVHPRLSIYIQPDVAGEAAGQLFYLQLRDIYFDVFVDSAKTTRFRVGQSKVPFGFENMQSSSNRVPLDRDDALNSALPNERDLGVIFYWEPPAARRRFRHLVDSGLKGSGDYGVIGLGLYNGQGTNRPEQNDRQHAVVRLAYPFLVAGRQYLELGVQAYQGRYVIPASQLTTGVRAAREFDDRRVAGTFVVYPQPIGIQAEWNVGRGPEFDTATNTIRERPLSGGYATLTYRARSREQTVIPFVRLQRYDGGKKFETDARSYRVREADVGVEWLPFAAFELTAEYVVADRTARDAAAMSDRQRGRFLRVQAQFNY